MSINLTIQLAQVSSNIELIQSEIAVQENQMDSLLNNRDGQADSHSMAQLQTYIGQLRMSLGAFRNQESYLKEQIIDDKNARGKDTNQLANG